jgi:cytoskeletal protein RodZ
VFEIGERLRQARTRQGLALSEVEAATRIRSGYLAALEDERFERLPSRAYARAFLRGYAEFLGLDATPFIDEFDSRFAEPEPTPPPSRRRLQLPGRATLVLTAAGLAVLASVLAFAFSGGATPHVIPPPSPPEPKLRVSTSRVVPPRPTQARQHPAARPPVSHLVLTASRGECWLSVHGGSAAGPLLYQGILPQGHSLEFFRRWLWIRMGAPSALTVTLDGSPVESLPTQAGNVLVTPRGVRAA